FLGLERLIARDRHQSPRRRRMPLAQRKRNEMGIKTIPHSEFDRLLPQDFTLEKLVGEEVEWFSNQSGNMVGTIAKGEGGAGWNYAILKRDTKGDSHVRKVMNNFFSLNAARVDLLLSMAGIEKIDSATRLVMSFDSFCQSSL
ncbi:MAG: hypothetical protein ACLQDC_03540, partial [Verrucomicrobiia bacterium]